MSTSNTSRFSTPSQVLQAASQLLSDVWSSRARFASVAGKSFLGDRDMYEVLGYKKTLNYEDFFARYDREGIAARIIEYFPSDAWTAGITIGEDETPGEPTPFEADIQSIITDHDLFGQMLTADIQAGIGKFSVIYIGTADENLMQPVSVMSGPEGIKYLSVYGENRVEVDGIVGDGKVNRTIAKAEMSDPRNGLPRQYKIEVSKGHKIAVHPSRVIHVAKGLLDNKVFGTELLRKGWNLLDDLLKIHGGGSEATWETVNPGYHWDVPIPSGGIAVELGEDEYDAMQEQLSLKKHKKAKDIITAGTNSKPLTSPVPQFAPNAQFIVRMLSATYWIPQQILLGAESGKMASTRDRDNVQESKREYIARHAEKVLRATVQRFIDIGAVSEPANGFKNKWPALDELTVQETSIALANIAKANKDNANAGGGLIYERDEIRQDIIAKGKFEGLEMPPKGSSGDTDNADDSNDTDDSDEDEDDETSSDS